MADETFTTKERWMFAARVIVSALLLISSLVVILSNKYPDATIKWAFGIVGLVIGFWLK